MKKFIVAGLISLISINAIAGIGGYEHSFDEETQSDTYRWVGFDELPPINGTEAELVKIFDIKYNPNKSSITDFNLYVRVKGVNSSSKYFHCGNPTWIIDGKPIRDVEQNYNEYKDGSTSFTFLTKQEFSEFAKAETVEYRMCGSQYALDKYETEGLQRVYSDFAKDHL